MLSRLNSCGRMGGPGNFVSGVHNSGRVYSNSNLSASAPPFTVDRSTGKSFAENHFPLYDSYYGTSPLSQGWQYPQPSAPISESMLDSMGLSSKLPLSQEFQFPGSAYANSDVGWSSAIPDIEASGNCNNKRPSYAPLFYGDSSMEPEDEVANFSYASTSLQGVDRLGIHAGKYAKMVEHGRDFYSFKGKDHGLKRLNNQLSQGIPEVFKPTEDIWESMSIPKHKFHYMESSNLSYQQPHDFSGRDVAVAPCSMGYVDKSLYPGEKHGVFPSYLRESRVNHHVPSAVDGIMQDFSKLKVSSCIGVTNDWPPFKGHTLPAHVRSSSGVTIRPPPASPIGKTSKSVVCSEASSAVNCDSGMAVHPHQSNMSKQQDYGMKPSSKTKRDSYETSITNFSMNTDGCIASALDSSKVFSMPCNKFEVTNSCKDSSDVSDHQNLEVDSPCWKGATSSSQTSFPEFGYSNCNMTQKALGQCFGYISCDLVKKALEGCDDQGNEHEKHQTINSLVEQSLTASENDQQKININKHECIDVTGMDDLYFRKEKYLNEDAKSSVDVPSSQSGKLEVVGNSSMQIDAVNDFEGIISELMDATEEEASGLALNGESNARHLSKEVLTSPVFQEDKAECINLRDSRLHVSTMIKAAYNISELLLVHFSDDASSVENENINDVKKTISNLTSCLSKRLPSTASEPNPATSEGAKSHVSGDSLNLNKISVTHPTEDYLRDLQYEVTIQHQLSDGRSSSSPCKKDIKCAYASLKNTDSAADDAAAKGIKKVLEENFEFNEEMTEQTELFKNLWLEAEAKLCSLNFRANFNRMKIHLEEMQMKTSTDKEDCTEEMLKDISNPIKPSEIQTPKVHVDQLNPCASTQNTSVYSSSINADDIDSSVMARFDILKSRKETVGLDLEGQKAESFYDNPADSLMPRIRFVKARNAKESELMPKGFDAESVAKFLGLGFQPEDETIIHNVDHNYAGYHDRNVFFPSLVDDQTPRSKNEDSASRNSSGLPDSFSFDWEHVPKDDLPWRN